MPATLLALQVFLILLPGFSAAYIVQALATRRSQSDLERVIESLVFNLLPCGQNGKMRQSKVNADSSVRIDLNFLWCFYPVFHQYRSEEPICLRL